KGPYAQPVVTIGYRERIPEHRTPIAGLYLATMSQIYPEDRGQNYSIKMGEKVAAMAMADGGPHR
ncbi:MAG: oxidoreductase, partial [Dehalococcoidia bacterium]